MKNRIIIIGAGGHGKVVYDAIVSQGKYSIVGFVDASVAIGTIVIDGFTVIASQNDVQTLKDKADYFIVAIGNNKIRNKLNNELKDFFKSSIIIHSSAIVGKDVKLGEGTVVLANAVISTLTNVGQNCIVNAGVLIDLECKIGNNIHLSIGTIVGSNSEIGDNYKSSIGEKMESFSKK